MNLRLKYFELSKEALEGLRITKQAVTKSGIGQKLLELVYLRISQMNGCVFCLHMHSTHLREMGESIQKIDSLPVWKLSPLFSEQERAALSWAEAITNIRDTRAPDEDYENLKTHFTDTQISDLSLAIANMNALNRIAISMRH